jgi:hypothetical protein
MGRETAHTESKMNDPDKKMRESRERAKREMRNCIREQIEIMRSTALEKKKREEWNRGEG